ncbi:hypothetical protein F2Q70_00008612 [Brassica cretica]|uniref:Uncharacterized protein n=1 Tax=Brassica cretica TaxID=69181 RepID=A0A8S9LWA5_BRACR|nr:hypothetical protein F2Q70_00008612 [Brassica cretica]
MQIQCHNEWRSETDGGAIETKQKKKRGESSSPDASLAMCQDEPLLKIDIVQSDQTASSSSIHNSRHVCLADIRSVLTIGPAYAILHGAFLVLLDGLSLGTGLSGRDGKDLREKCFAFLLQQLKVLTSDTLPLDISRMEQYGWGDAKAICQESKCSAGVCYGSLETFSPLLYLCLCSDNIGQAVFSNQ